MGTRPLAATSKVSAAATTNYSKPLAIVTSLFFMWGSLSGTGSGLLNMAIVGGAIIPVIQGVIADHVGLHHAFLLPLPCYLYIVFYALKGSKPNSERYANA